MTEELKLTLTEDRFSLLSRGDLKQIDRVAWVDGWTRLLASPSGSSAATQPGLALPSLAVTQTSRDSALSHRKGSKP